MIGEELNITDYKLLVNNTMTSMLILESDGDINLDFIAHLDVREKSDQIAFIRALKRFNEGEEFI